MNEEKGHSLKELVIIFTGVFLSLTALVYLVKQYSKALVNFLTLPGDGYSRIDEEKISQRFRQIDDEGAEVPHTGEDDIAADIEF